MTLVRRTLRIAPAMLVTVITTMLCGWVPASAAEDDVTVVRDVVYASEDDSDPRRMDIVIPGESAYGERPILMYIHGGSWRMNDRSWGDKAPMLDSFVRRGYVVASIDYRLTTQSPWPAQLVDCRQAVRFLRVHAGQFGADPDRIAVFGDSAGGHLAMMLGASDGDPADVEPAEDGRGATADVQAVISLYGIADLALWGTLPEDLAEEAELSKTMLLGTGYTRDDALAASPITYVDGDELPMMLAHAQDDGLVSVSQSRLMAETLELANGEDSCVTWYPETGGHGSPSVFYDNVEAQKCYLDFLDGVWERDGVSGSGSRGIEVRRLRGIGSEGHVYSVDINEYTVLDQQKAGWVGEGTAFRAISVPFANNRDTPVYRLYDPVSGMHLLSSDEREYDTLTRRGWQGEGVMFASPWDGDQMVYRLYHPSSGEHLYTTDEREYRILGASGWNQEGKAFNSYSGA